jgi:hypothetical protein
VKKPARGRRKAGCCSDNAPIIVGGSPDETFDSIIANIANQAMGFSRTTNVKDQSSVSLEWRGLSDF